MRGFGCVTNRPGITKRASQKSPSLTANEMSPASSVNHDPQCHRALHLEVAPRHVGFAVCRHVALQGGSHDYVHIASGAKRHGHPVAAVQEPSAFQDVRVAKLPDGVKRREKRTAVARQRFVSRAFLVLFIRDVDARGQQKARSPRIGNRLRSVICRPVRLPQFHVRRTSEHSRSGHDVWLVAHEQLLLPHF